jgi:hypothetical protein
MIHLCVSPDASASVTLSPEEKVHEDESTKKLLKKRKQMKMLKKTKSPHYLLKELKRWQGICLMVHLTQQWLPKK